MSYSLPQPQRESTDWSYLSSSYGRASDMMPYPGGFQTTHWIGAQDSLAVKVIGPFLFVLIAMVVVCFVVSFVKFRIERQIRRRKAENQSTGTANSTQRTVTKRMHAYALPYNVLDLQKVAELQSELHASSSGASSAFEEFRGHAMEQDQDANTITFPGPRNDPAEISELRYTSEIPSTFQELAVQVNKVYSNEPGLETRFPKQTPFRDGIMARPNNTLKQAKSKLKKLKRRRIQPFSKKVETPRRQKKLSEDEFSSTGSGILHINDSFELDSCLSTTSTFRMKLYQP